MIIRQFQAQAQQNPWGFAHLWTVQALALTPPLDLTLVGDPEDSRTQALLRTAHRSYLPERRLVLKDPGNSVTLGEILPWTGAYSQPGDAPVAYLCRDFTCLPAVGDPEELKGKLGRWEP